MFTPPLHLVSNTFLNDDWLLNVPSKSNFLRHFTCDNQCILKILVSMLLSYLHDCKFVLVKKIQCVPVPTHHSDFQRQMSPSVVWSEIRWEVIVRFIDISGIVDHHCLIKKKFTGSFDLKPQSIGHVKGKYIDQCTSIPKLGTEEIVPPVAMWNLIKIE